MLQLSFSPVCVFGYSKANLSNMSATATLNCISVYFHFHGGRCDVLAGRYYQTVFGVASLHFLSVAFRGESLQTIKSKQEMIFLHVP